MQQRAHGGRAAGAGDPENRAPMPWELANDENEAFAWTKKLIQLRRANRALKIGDYRKLISGRLIAFERLTDKVEDTVVVAANSTAPAVNCWRSVRTRRYQ